jgi:hypothetical protein
VNKLTTATVVKGVLNPATGQRSWRVLAQSEPYPADNAVFNHQVNGICVTRDGQSVLVAIGARTDHGEIEDDLGAHPGVREVGLTTIILTIPVASENAFLPNDRSQLRSLGYLFAEGIRNTFDMAYTPTGDLIGPDNGPDRDMSEKLNWLRPGQHYGFPWRLGGADNPQQFPNYNPSSDLLLNTNYYAVQQKLYAADPTFPPPPNGVSFVEPILNFGPDADRYRDPATGQVHRASLENRSISTFTPHRSPLGISFDVNSQLPPAYRGDGFLLSWTKGDPIAGTNSGPFFDASQDLLQLKLTRLGTTNYAMNSYKLVDNFQNPVDSEFYNGKLYILEYGGTRGLWELTFLTPPTAASPVITQTPGSNAQYSVSALLSASISGSGAPLTLIQVNSPSANGASVRVVNGTIFYDGTTYSGTDTFTYVISDGTLTATGTVTVIPEPPSTAEVPLLPFWAWSGIAGTLAFLGFRRLGTR